VLSSRSELVPAVCRRPGHKFKAFEALFIAGLESATEIVNAILLSGGIPDLISATSDRVLFHRLRFFAEHSRWITPSIISFLQFHSTVEHLCLFHRFDNAYPLPSTGVVLPCLRTYDGPSHVVHLVIPGSPVSAATISWGFDPADPSDFDLVLSSLAKSSVPVTTLACRGYCWKLEFLPLLVKYLADIESLEFFTNGASVSADVSRIVILLFKFV